MARRRRSEPSGASGGDSFALMFTSLNLILLSFFILLNALSVRDTDRARKAIGSLRGSFGILTGGESPSREGDQMLRGDAIGGEPARHHGMVAEAQGMLQRGGSSYGADDVLLVPTTDGLRLELSDRVLFHSGRTEIDPQIFPLLDDLAAMVRRAQRTVTIEGFADPAQTVHYPSNLELSASRAVRVAEYLVKAARVPPRRVRAVGRGVQQGTRGRRFVSIVIADRALARPLESH